MPPGLRWIVVVALGLLSVVAPTVVPSLPAGGQGSDLPDTVTLYAVIPADQPIDYGLADAALHEAEVAMGWVEQQTDERFRRGPAFTEIRHLAHPATAYVGTAEQAYDRIHAEVMATIDDPDVFPLIMADLRSDPDGVRVRTCGIGGPLGVVMMIDNCPGQRLSTTSAWGSEASITIAHELLHGLGAVPSCAPHGRGGHVTDDPNDIVSIGAVHRVPPASITLDAGHDDYFDHEIPGCPDILDSPLWDR